jgi:hypothetical protein
MIRSSVINMDETATRLHGGRNVTWAKVRADGVRIDNPSNPEDCFTVVAARTVSGAALRLTFVARGKTVLCHKGFGDIGQPWTHTPKVGGRQMSCSSSIRAASVRFLSSPPNPI